MRKFTSLIVLTTCVLLLIPSFAFAEEIITVKKLEREGVFGTIGAMLGGRTLKVVYEDESQRIERKGVWRLNGGFQLGVGYGFSDLLLWKLDGFYDIVNAEAEHLNIEFNVHFVDLLTGFDFFVGDFLFGASTGYAFFTSYHEKFGNKDTGIGNRVLGNGLAYRTKLAYEFPIQNTSIGIAFYFGQAVYWYSQKGANFDNVHAVAMKLGLNLYFRLY